MNNEHVAHRVSILGFGTWNSVICATSEKWTCCIHIFGSQALGFGTRNSELDDLCNIIVQWTWCTLGFEFLVSALETWWYVQWVRNGHVVYIFSGFGEEKGSGLWRNHRRKKEISKSRERDTNRPEDSYWVRETSLKDEETLARVGIRETRATRQVQSTIYERAIDARVRTLEIRHARHKSVARWCSGMLDAQRATWV